MGIYTEPLKSGGKLNVTKNSWTIEYYFPGPDLRYKGTFFRIQGKDIEKYISAWKNNFQKYLELKKTFPLTGSYDTVGEAGMKIRIGGYSEGVHIDGWHMPVKDTQRIKQITEDYTQAKIKAEAIQKILAKL